MYLRVVTCVIACAAASAVNAATITVTPLDQPGGASIIVEGEFTASDASEFRLKIAPYSKGIVTLRSDGGSALAGIEIGKIIRLRSFLTWVPSGIRCASACAFAWLGGTPRVMGKDALIGFHAAYRIADGIPTEVGAANAVLGSYLSQLGLSDRAIIYVSQASPTSMTWLTPADADRVGIDVKVYDPQTSATTSNDVPKPNASLNFTPNFTPQVNASDIQAPFPGPTEGQKQAARVAAATPQLRRRAAEFLAGLYNGLAKPSDAAISLLSNAYAEKVTYYGKELSHEKVVEQVQRFVKRWPVRIYKIRESSLNIQCDEAALTCIAKGTLDFDSRSVDDNRRSVGSATFDYALALPPQGQVTITRENGAVLERTLQPLVEQQPTLRPERLD